MSRTLEKLIYSIAGLLNFFRFLIILKTLSYCLGGFFHKKTDSKKKAIWLWKTLWKRVARDYREWWCIEILSNGKLMGSKAIFCTFIDRYRHGGDLLKIWNTEILFVWLESRFIKVQTIDEKIFFKKITWNIKTNKKKAQNEKPLQLVF